VLTVHSFSAFFLDVQDTFAGGWQLIARKVISLDASNNDGNNNSSSNRGSSRHRVVSETVAMRAPVRVLYGSTHGIYVHQDREDCMVGFLKQQQRGQRDSPNPNHTNPMAPHQVSRSFYDQDGGDHDRERASTAGDGRLEFRAGKSVKTCETFPRGM